MFKQASSSFDSQINSLMASLRRSGWTDEVKNLEKSYVAWKTAEVHMYRAIDEDGEDVIRSAHPDGGLNLGLSRNDKVETTLEIHDEILNAINHQPTGKLGSFKEQIGQILGVKQGQAATDIQEQPANLAAATSHRQKIGQINSYLAENWPKLIANINSLFSIFNAVGADGQTIWAFNSNQLLAWGQRFPKLASEYGRRSGTENALGQYLALHAKVYGDTNPANFNANALVRRILSITGYDSLKQFGSLVDSNISANYFVGSQPSIKKDRKGWLGVNLIRSDEEHAKEYWRDNPNSIWLPAFVGSFDKDEKKVSEAANALHESMRKRFEAILGSDALARANASIAGDLAKVKEGISAGLTVLGTETPQYTETSRSTFDTIDKLAACNAQLGKLGQEGSLGKLLLSVISALEIPNTIVSPEGFYSKVGASLNDNSNVIRFLNGISLSPLDFTYSAEAAQAAAGQYNAALDALRSRLEMAREGTDLYNSLSNDIQTTQNLMNIVLSGAGNKFYKVFDQLKKSFDWTPQTADEVTQGATEWRTAIEQANTARAFLAPHTFFKTAGPPVPSSVGGGNKPATGPKPSSGSGGMKTPATTSIGKPSAAVKKPTPGQLAKLSEEEKTAVKVMQDVLNSLGELLEQTRRFSRVDTIKLKNSGEGRNTAYGDGFWGERTSIGLDTANRLLRLRLIVNRETETVVEDAEQNTRILEGTLRKVEKWLADKGLGTAGRKGSGMVLQGQEVDKLPTKIDWNSMPETATMDGGKIPLTLGNLSSLSALYNFLTKKGLQAPQSEGASELSLGQEGYSAWLWGRILEWFKRRAVLLYNTFKGKPDLSKYQERAKTYYGQVEGLQKKLAELFKSLPGTDPKTKFTQLITPETLREFERRSVETNEEDLGDDFVSPEEGWRGGRSSGKRNVLDSDGLIPASYQEIGAGPKGNKRRAPGGGRAGEGRSLDTPPPDNTAPPIGRNIDLRTDWYGEKVGSDALTSPILNYDQFLRIPAVTLAQTMMLGDVENIEADPNALYYTMIASNIPAQNIRWNRSRNEYEIYWQDYDSKTVQWVPLSILQSRPGFVNNYPSLAAKTQNPIDRFQNFLLRVRQFMNKAVSDWIAEAQPTEEEITNASEWLARWQKAINNKLRQISDWRRGG